MEIATGGEREGRQLAAAFRGAPAGLWAFANLKTHLENERARWFTWLPVAFGCGIAAYFALGREPGPLTTVALAIAGAALVAATRPATFLRLAAATLFAASLGFAAAKARTEVTRAPVLAEEMRYAKILGVVELIEPRPTRGERLTLRIIEIDGLAPDATPERVRIRVAAKREGLKPGDTVRLTATLRPPPKPAIPGGYDFARTAWFQKLGATGYAYKAVDIEAPTAPHASSFATDIRERLERLRQNIGERIRAAVPGESGAIAVSLITGERGGITEQTNAAYRDSGLVHVLSISGLHMVIMAGSVFLSVRLLLALFPAVALRIETKKWAAAAGLLGAAGYLMISGGSIPTIRAFIMIAIMFVAVMLDRQALAMRNVAIAALVVLIFTPESLLDAGFQMSFAAVVSLVAAYEAIRNSNEQRESTGWLRLTAFFFGGIVLSTVIASLAVSPFGIYHFHQSQQYALIANMMAIPICNLIIMPAALLTLVVMPLGLEFLSLWVMAKGIDAMTWTAYWVAGLPGAVVSVPEIPGIAFALLVAGGLWLTLWQTRWRALGLASIGAGIMLAGGGTRPDILAGRGGDLVAIRAHDGQLAAVGRGSFELSRWLTRDGDSRPTRDALKSRTFRCDGAGCVGETGGLRVAVQRHPAATAEDCTAADILIAGPSRPRGCTAPIAVIDRWALRDDGTHAIYLERDEADGASPAIARIETVAAARGVRPWAKRPDRRTRFERTSRRATHGLATDRTESDE